MQRESVIISYSTVLISVIILEYLNIIICLHCTKLHYYTQSNNIFTQSNNRARSNIQIKHIEYKTVTLHDYIL